MIKINEIFRVLKYFQCNTFINEGVTLDVVSSSLSMKTSKINLCLEVLKQAGVFNIIQEEINGEVLYHYRPSYYYCEVAGDGCYSVYYQNELIGRITTHKLPGKIITYCYSYPALKIERYMPVLDSIHIEMFFSSILDTLADSDD